MYVAWCRVRVSLIRLNSDDGAENKLMEIASDARRHAYTTSHSLVEHRIIRQIVCYQWVPS